MADRELFLYGALADTEYIKSVFGEEVHAKKTLLSIMAVWFLQDIAFLELAALLLHDLRRSFTYKSQDQVPLERSMSETIEALNYIHEMKAKIRSYHGLEKMYNLDAELNFTEKYLEHSEKLYRFLQDKRSDKYNKLISVLLMVMSLIQLFPLIYELLSPTPISAAVRYAISGFTCLSRLVIFTILTRRSKPS
jgi:hypothetical protein